MARVPIQVGPEVQMNTQGPGQIQAGPDVQPVKNFAPEQISKFGAAQTKQANMIASIQTKLQDDYNDARAKQMYNNYAREVTQLQTEFQQRRGVDAMGASFDGSVGALNDLRERYMAEADNDRIGVLFDNRAQVLMTSSAGQMSSHSLNQGREYGIAESRAEAANNIEFAARSWRDYEDPNGDFNTFTASAIQQVNDLADSMGLGPDSHQREQMVRGAYQDLHQNVVFNMAQEDRFIEAQAYLEDVWSNGEIGIAEYQRLTNTLSAGAAREEGIDLGRAIFGGARAQTPENYGTFEGSIGTIFMLEGGYVADDAGAGPTKYGINGRANGLTDAQVANLTRDEALEIYRTRYWNDVGIDDLPPEARMIAFDAAVNQGQGAARTMIREATRDDGSFDLGRFIALRRDRYEATANSGRFAEMPQEERDMYMRSWEGRMAAITGGSPISLDRETGLPNVSAMTTHIRNTIDDPDVQEIAIAEVTALHRQQDLAIAQEYRNDLDEAQDIAFARIGGWEDISDELLGRIKPADMALLREGPNRGNDPETYLELLQNPELAVMAPRDANGNRIPGQGGLEDYRMRLSESTYRQFVANAMANEAEAAANAGQSPTIRAATADQDMLNATLLRANRSDPGNVGATDISKLIDPGNDEQRNDRIRLIETWRSRINVRQEELDRALTRDEKQQLLDTIILDTVMQNDTFGSTVISQFEIDQDNAEYAFVTVNTGGGAREQLLLANIPAAQISLITDAYRRGNNGRFPTQIEIAQMWVDGGRQR